MFRFVDRPSLVYCDIKACDSRKYNCDTVCPADGEERKRRELEEIVTSRSARSVSETENHGKAYRPNILTVGPMRSKERFTAETLEGGKQKYESKFLLGFAGFDFGKLYQDIWAQLGSFGNSFYRSTSEH